MILHPSPLLRFENSPEAVSSFQSQARRSEAGRSCGFMTLQLRARFGWSLSNLVALLRMKLFV
jgi:hypothetical protein